MPKRIDYQIISSFINKHSKVLDLGCGDGALLRQLKEEKSVTGEGVEISGQGVVDCIKKGLAVHHADINEGLSEYADKSFDYVILSQTLQMTDHPEFVINEMLRVGAKAIVSFPNFAHYAMRTQLLFLGRMPVTGAFPYQWYDTPNIRHTTVKDFKVFCETNRLKILDEVYLNDFNRKQKNIFVNLSAKLAIFLLAKGGPDEHT